MPISDTTPEAQAVQDAIHRAMTGEERVLLTFEMSEFVRELARAGIREMHPDWPEERVARELLRMAFFPEPLPAGFLSGLPDKAEVGQFAV